jgi:hypothetical protein
MRRYFSDDVWEPVKRFYEEWPAEQWIGLFRDSAAAISEGPASPRAEDLLRRWNALGQSLSRELASASQYRELRDGFARAWMDRQNWPDTLKRRFADYRMNEVSAFLGRVSIVVLNRRGPSWFVEQGDGSAHVA